MVGRHTKNISMSTVSAHIWTSMAETHDTYKGHDIFHDYERLCR